MAKRKSKPNKQSRRTFTKEFKREVVQMLLDNHSASSVSKNLGIRNTNLIYRGKAELIDEGAPVAEAREDEVRGLREELQRTRGIGRLEIFPANRSCNLGSVNRAIGDLNESKSSSQNETLVKQCYSIRKGLLSK